MLKCVFFFDFKTVRSAIEGREARRRGDERATVLSGSSFQDKLGLDKVGGSFCASNEESQASVHRFPKDEHFYNTFISMGNFSGIKDG